MLGNNDPDKSTSIKRLLRNSDKGITRCRGTGGVLSKLFRMILAEYSVDLPKWDGLMNNHVRKSMRNVSQDNIKVRTSLRGNLNKELAHPAMSWKTFNQKALPLLNVKRYTIELTLEHEGGRYTKVKEVVDTPLTDDSSSYIQDTDDEENNKHENKEMNLSSEEILKSFKESIERIDQSVDKNKG